MIYADFGGIALTNCKICKEKTTVKRQPSSYTTYYQCIECGFIFKDEADVLPPTDEFNCYELHHNSIDNPNYVDRFKIFLNQAVFPYIQSIDTLLDFGSGPEPVLAQLLQRDYKIHADIYDLYYAPKSINLKSHYSVITATEVFEHLVNPIEITKQLHNLLVPNGILAIQTEFITDKALKNFFGWHYMREATHVSFYTPKSFEILGDKVGLEVIYTNHRNLITLRRNN